MLARPFVTEALVVTQYYWPEPIGTAPYCTDLAERLAADGTAVQVATGRPHYPGNRIFPDYADGGNDRQAVNGVRIERLRTWIPKKKDAVHRILHEFLFFAQGVIALATGRIKRRAFVLSVSPSILAVLLGALAKKWSGRHVALVHDIQSGLAAGLGMVGQGLPLRAMRRFEALVLNRVDLVLVLSDEMRRQLVGQGVRTRVEVLPIWIDTEKIFPIMRRTERAALALYSGNLGRKQALHQILDLAEELQRREADLRIILRGDGSELSALTEETARRHLENIEFHPLVPAARLREGLADGDIHLVPQDPNAADYAVPSKIYGIMAAARPFVATAPPGTQLWSLQQETGAFLCVPPNDPAAFADAVMALARQPALRADLGFRGWRYVKANHARDGVLNRFQSMVGHLG